MNTWTFEHIEMPEIGVMRYDLKGQQTPDKTFDNTRQLCERLEAEAWKGVLFDYTDCQIGHTLPEFDDLLDFLARNLPKDIKIAYVFDKSTFVPAAKASRTLQQAGIDAQAFTDDEEALSFLTLRNWCRPLHA